MVPDFYTRQDPLSLTKEPTTVLEMCLVCAARMKDAVFITA